MNGKPERQTLLEVQDYFDLPSPSLMEKDWHVVQALAAIHDAASDGLTLVFGAAGGAGSRRLKESGNGRRAGLQPRPIMGDDTWPMT